MFSDPSRGFIPTPPVGTLGTVFAVNTLLLNWIWRKTELNTCSSAVYKVWVLLQQCRGGNFFLPCWGSRLVVHYSSYESIIFSIFSIVWEKVPFCHMTIWTLDVSLRKGSSFFLQKLQKNPHSGRLKWRTAKKRLFLEAGLQQFLFWNVMTTDSDASSAF